MKKQAAIIAVCAALLICVAAAGCTSSSSSPTASATAHSSSNAPAASTNVTATPTVTPLPKASPSKSVKGLTVLYFHKDGCPACTALEAKYSFKQLQTEVTVEPIESATSPLTNQYSVTSVPTLILLNNGSEAGRWVNPPDATAILAQINGG